MEREEFTKDELFVISCAAELINTKYEMNRYKGVLKEIGEKASRMYAVKTQRELDELVETAHREGPNG